LLTLISLDEQYYKIVGAIKIYFNLKRMKTFKEDLQYRMDDTRLEEQIKEQYATGSVDCFVIQDSWQKNLRKVDKTFNTNGWAEGRNSLSFSDTTNNLSKSRKKTWKIFQKIDNSKINIATEGMKDVICNGQ